MAVIEKKNYPSGKLNIEITTQDDKLHCTYRHWTETGILVYEANHKNGNLHGTERAWYYSGKLRHEIQWENGEFHGSCKTWNKHGELIKGYYLYGKYVTKEEFRKYELVEKLAGLE